jgi:murein DD-endopeptidase MepM/ murein hydrolase activator NlpD
VQVKPGAAISRGTVLGEVGLSGFTEFAHLHFEVRHGDTVIDPFTGKGLGEATGEACGTTQGALWDGPTLATLARKPAAFLVGGFAGDAVDLRTLELAPPSPPTATSQALLAYVRILGVQAGDIETLSIVGPDAAAFGTKGPVALTSPKVQWLSYLGRKRGGEPWQSGDYRARYRLERNGRVLINEEFSFRLRGVSNSVVRE